MRTIPAIAAGAALLALACETGPPAPPPLRLDPQTVSADGLVRVKNSRAQVVFVKPGADLSHYTRLNGQLVDIRYKSPPRNDRRGTNFPLSDRQMENLRGWFDEVFTEELERSQRFTLTDETGPDVLNGTANIVDLQVRAPPRPVSGRNNAFVNTAGALTLVLELSDSQSREVLVRLADRQVARGTGGGVTLSVSNPVTDRASVRRIFRAWAQRLRAALDSIDEFPSLPAATAEETKGEE